MAKHHRSAPDTNMSDLTSLKSSLRSRVHTIEVLLGTMTTPVQNLAQEIEHTGYIKRINEMTFEANGNLLDIKAEHGNDIEAPELVAFKTSLANRQDVRSQRRPMCMEGLKHHSTHKDQPVTKPDHK